MNLNPLDLLFPGRRARREANEQRMALLEEWRHEERMKMVRMLMDTRGRRR